MNWFKRIVDLFRGPPAIAGYDPIKHVVVLMFENHSFD